MSGKSLLIIFFLLGIFLAFIGRVVQVQMRGESFTPQKSTFTFKSPEQALQGKVRATIGDVKKQSRDSDKLEKINVVEPVFQGDKFETGNAASLTVQFGDIGIVNVKADSKVNIISLVPASFLMQQTDGTITYETLSNTPMSVRTLHVLFTLQSGTGSVVTDAEIGEVTVSLTAGKGKLAMIDNDNKTHTWDIKVGQKATIDDEARTVKISK